MIPCEGRLSQYDIPESFSLKTQLPGGDICTISSQRLQVVLLHFPACISAADTGILTSVSHSLVYLCYSLSSSRHRVLCTPDMFRFLLFSSPWTTS